MKFVPVHLALLEYVNGVPLKEIGTKFGVAQGTIQDRLRSVGVKHFSNANRPRKRDLAYGLQSGRGNFRKYGLWSKYRMTLAEYSTLFDQQGGGCKICGVEPVEKYSLYVDHSHKTGKIRGLLCRACNAGLGHFTDDPSKMRMAILYLEESV